jgi:putative ABC transport system permease protein
MSGVAGRKVIVRWTWRLVRRDWRQQLLVLALITFAVAACLFATIAAVNMPRSNTASFGDAEHRILLASDEPDAIAPVVADMEQRFGPLEVIGHTAVPIPGSVDTLDFRTQDTAGPLGAPMLALRSGRYPSSANEVAVTDGAADAFHLVIGDHVTLGSGSKTVVGTVENPADLGDEFIVSTPTASDLPESVTLLLNGHDDELGNRPGRITQLRLDDRRVTALSDTGESSERGAVALVMLSLDTVAMLLVSLIAAAAFVVIAQRRMRQLGMLAAIGANRAHLRLAMVAHGLAVGIIAAIAGNVVAFSTWFAFSSSLENLANHRIDPASDIPFDVVILGTVLAVVTTTAAAWWPARASSRVPIVRALSGRPPDPSRVHRSAAAGIAFLALGCVVLVVGIDKSGEASPYAAIGGPIAIVFGILFLCPLAIRTLGPFARRLPVTSRLALRDLTRYQARAGGALAAITLGLGIACTTIIVAAAATPPDTGGNLASDQLLFRLSGQPLMPEVSAEELARLEADVNDFAAKIGADVYPLDAVFAARPDESGETPNVGKPVIIDPRGETGQPVIMVGHRVDHGIELRNPDVPYVATPQLLALRGIDPGTVAADVDVITPESGPLVFVDLTARIRGPEDATDIRALQIDDPGYSEVPQTFITEEAIRAHGWTTRRIGWFVDSHHALTAGQRSDARDIAASSGTVAITRDQHHALGITRSIATAAGMLLTLAILAMTIGLIRSEAQRDLQTLTAAGATSVTRRTITATTAAALALLGAILGLVGAYIALIAGFSDDLHPLTRVPTTNLLTIVLGLPIAAGIGGWLLAGRQPSAITRQALE